MRTAVRLLVAVLTLAPLGAVAGQGKGRVELTPFLGMYLPVVDLINLSDPAGSGVTLVFSQKSAFSFGGRLGYGISDRAAIEGAFGYTASEVKLEVQSDFGSGSTALGGTVIQASARVRYRLNAPYSPTGWHITGGLAMISRGGEMWDSLETGGIRVDGRTDFGAVIGGGVTLPVGKGLALRIDLEDYIHQAKFTLEAAGQSADTESQIQNDFVLSVGLAIQVGGRK